MVKTNNKFQLYDKVFSNKVSIMHSITSHFDVILSGASICMKKNLNFVLSSLLLFSCISQADVKIFVHPGMLSTEADFTRAAQLVSAKTSPAIDSWNILTASHFANANYAPQPQSYVIRGNPSWGKDNYVLLFRDAAAAYQLALRWKISGDTQYADAAARVLDGWSKTLSGVGGTSDRFLTSGIYGYELANAGEILRTYPGWKGLADLQNMMLKVFYPMNHDFLTNHITYGAEGKHYWANWDLANMASMMAIGILTDRDDIYHEALNYAYNGKGNGAFTNAMWHVSPEGLAQVQESGRDQGHTTLDIVLLGVLCQMAWNQGDDLFSYNENLLLKASEYVAKYNLGNDVPWTTYTSADGWVQSTISSSARGNIRPAWTLIYNHYSRIKNLPAVYTGQMMNHVGAEGGGGNYGGNSGGFDQLGFGSLLYNSPAQ
ncbi:alginate lyase family protein [Erwinia pyrifoliae]|uniref:alginate lyase family protein n=1 Tax=Erwinia pyrifoliae TaxID=79967 RepID=UPI00220344B3|nr:alginate lyase family protein [Erwinia pyrifoliae]MCT2387507.1 alginate lyase family protein [Erwinia pyrifoliae]MCU8585762.1 alginate lyase family protein [Erwinia pyrifoliae]UWS28945.1 alginate lyase family protein [Erwinia pyrifoliae]